MDIQSIRNALPTPQIQGVQNAQNSTAASKSQGVSFNQLLDSLSQTQNNSDALLQKLAAGEDVDLHQVMIASEQTDISFKVAIAIRDQLVEAYREAMRMNV